ncbi:GTPase/DUF3482 domain-containing protein [Desulfoplanes sp.]
MMHNPSQNTQIPEFAIIGHPNEGKSSIVSTLAEDDTVPISRIPGETTQSRVYPVSIDGRDIIRFIDTPGFQNPMKTLKWLRDYSGPPRDILHAFYRAHIDRPESRDECELFLPILDRGGIIYVVDGSRPMRRVDRAEMEILRLTGRPRMAIINCKETGSDYLQDWKAEFARQFNMTRTFDALKATYSERIALLEGLRSIEQDWEAPLRLVVTAFKKDWERRNTLTVTALCDLLRDCTSYVATKTSSRSSSIPALKENLLETFKTHVGTAESRCHKRIKQLFKHNIFSYPLPDQSILNEDLFAQNTWHILGLTPTQLAATAALTGGTVGAAVDLAAAGMTFGIFTALGSAAAAGYVLLNGERLAKTRVKGMGIGGYTVQVGPVDNIQILYILIDRALLYYTHVINWAHARRDDPPAEAAAMDTGDRGGFSSKWGKEQQEICSKYLAALKQDRDVESREQAFMDMIQEELIRISRGEIAGKGREDSG